MRAFGNKKIELLAPAGNFEIFKGIVDSKCDAVYFGGQRMNMRMIRKGYNFTDAELKEAVDLANEKGKATYVTVNNLLDYEEVEAADAYLGYLAEIKPTGIIVQDFAILERIKALNLDLEVHASVMMNVHNLEMIRALERHGVKRVVLSRETTLAEAHHYHTHSNVELEYFTHGDMCVAHGAQCYYSSMLFGMSSNRGKCLKPCRWWFDRNGDRAFPLAVKDMSMIAHLPEMIHAGITSYKIEGRMREKEFIVDLINRYGDVFDRYIEDPIGYDYKQQEAWIYENRKRDLSTAFAFGNPGIENINTRYEGTGKFYSTGKMFSTPTQESQIDQPQLDFMRSVFTERSEQPLKISVRVEDMEQAQVALEEGVDRIYLAADVFEPKVLFTLADVLSLVQLKEKSRTELYVSLPKMMDEVQFDRYKEWLGKCKGIDGLLITNLGALEAFKSLGLKMVGDYSLNIYNPSAATFYRNEGLTEITPSIELSAKHLHALLKSDGIYEVISHGRMTSMYMAHDLYKAYDVDTTEPLLLENEAGQYLVKRDVFGKSHLLMQSHYTLMPIINRLCNARVRIEAQTETPEDLREIIKAHIQAFFDADLSSVSTQSTQSTYTFGATRF